MLKSGDKIGIISLAGDCNKDKVLAAKAFFESCGYQVELSKNIFDKKDYLSGDDSLKIDELHRFFLDPNIKIIINARGGYGSIRLINSINYELIKNYYKPFCGYSDITAILLMLYKNCGFITYHGPMACSDFSCKSEDLSKFTIDNYYKTINNEALEFCGKNVYRNVDTQGILWGGNLSTVVSLCGLDFLPNEDFIFFAEDINEPVYKIDKMFQQLMNIPGFLQKCKAIVLGEFLGIDNQIWLDNYFYELSERYIIPIVSGFAITHGKNKITVPIGKKGSLKNSILRL